jgi:hypothetical protein
MGVHFHHKLYIKNILPSLAPSIRGNTVFGHGWSTQISKKYCAGMKFAC